jgi:hypothetical protein
MLKRWIIVLIIGCVMTQLCSGLFIISSFYLNQQEIARTLCVNRFDKIPVCKGSCYLNDQLKETQEKEPVKYPSFKLKTVECVLPPAETPTVIEQPVVPAEKKIVRLGETNHVPSSYTTSVFHPPQQSV